MALLLQVIRGFLVGLAGLLPGLCGSTLLVVFGIYRPLTAALAHPFADFRGNVARFGPFLLAAGIGMLVGSFALAGIFARHEIATLYLFMGFMVGTLPDLFRHAHRAQGPPAGWLAFGATFALCLALATLPNRLDSPGAAPEATWRVWLLAGAGIGIGSVVPGASVAFLLIYFGIYQPMLAGVAALDPHVLLPLGAGAGAAILIFARAAHWLFRKAEGPTTCGVLGLVVGSLWLVWPGWPGGIPGLRCLGLFLLGGVLSAFLNKLAPAPAQA